LREKISEIQEKTTEEQALI